MDITSSKVFTIVFSIFLQLLCNPTRDVLPPPRPPPPSLYPKYIVTTEMFCLETYSETQQMFGRSAPKYVGTRS